MEHHALISITQNGDPYENAMAERVNCILKSELIAESYTDVREAMQHITRCISMVRVKPCIKNIIINKKIRNQTYCYG